MSDLIRDALVRGMKILGTTSGGFGVKPENIREVREDGIVMLFDRDAPHPFFIWNEAQFDALCAEVDEQ